MIPLLALWGCLKPAPPPAPAPGPTPPLAAPSPARSTVAGWSLLQADGTHWWADLTGPDVAELARQALEQGRAASALEPPPDGEADPELARHALMALGARSRPPAWAFAPTSPSDLRAGPLVERAPELIAAEPIRGVDGAPGIRLWFRPLDRGPTTLAVTPWKPVAEAPEGLLLDLRGAAPTCESLGQEPVPLGPDLASQAVDQPPWCTALELPQGTLVATVHPMEPSQTGSPSPCVAAAIRHDHGGVRWVQARCGESAILPLGWFRTGEGSPVVVGSRPASPNTRCLATLPEAHAPFVPWACAAAAPDPADSAPPP